MNVIHELIRRACLVCAVAVLVGQAHLASAQKLLIDFGNNVTQYRGIAVPNPDPNGNYWNSIQPGLLVSNMIDTQNHATTISLGWDSPVGTDSYNGPAGATDAATLPGDVFFTDIDAAALGDLGVKEAAFDYAASPIQDDTRALFDIEGLDPTKKYSLTFYGSHKYSNDPTTVYSVYSDSGYSNLLGTANLNVVDPLDASKHNRDKVVTISNLSPLPATGILYVQFVGSTGNLGYLNSMEITTTTPAGVIGDYNNNGKVDAADYVLWRNNLGTTNVLPNDPVGGTIGITQYNNWKSHFGATPGSGSGLVGSAVPEPGSLMLVLGAVVGLFSVNRKR